MAETSQIKEKFEDYEGFVEKFKPKKTTDDCYTPPAVYEVLLKWVDDNIMPLEGKNIVRPFWPGADYTAREYGPDDVVIDNPPFSCLAKICRWYTARGVKYFLFAPSLTLFSSSLDGETYIVTNTNLIFENGAKINISFRTNMLGGRPRVSVRGDLYEYLTAVQKALLPSKKCRQIIHPDCVITSATLGRLAVRGICIDFNPEDTHYVRKLDNAQGGVYGGGYLLSERAAAMRAAAERVAAERAAAMRVAAERAAAERAAAERAAAERIILSDREREIINSLSNPR